MALRILTGERADALDASRAWPAAAELLGRSDRGSLAGEWDDLASGGAATDGPRPKSRLPPAVCPTR